VEGVVEFSVECEDEVAREECWSISISIKGIRSSCEVALGCHR
jgi:hypothetical protein